MAFHDTKCACGGHKLTDTMLCAACEASASATPEMRVFRDHLASQQSRRSAAIRLLAMSRHLAHLTTRPQGCAPKTQDQALNALVFAYKHGLGKPLGQMPEWVKPPERRPLPVWLSSSEFQALSLHLEGSCLLIAQIMFGSGLRLNEGLQLRVRDIDLHARLITVRGGKGNKDRTTCLPVTLVPVLQQRLERLAALWEADRSANLPGVWLPDAVARKYPNYGKDWPWQFLFPGRQPCRDPDTGIIRRHHLHEDTLAKALKRAARAAHLGKRITVHTLRHSFATSYLENGGSIHKLKELLGHDHLETTEIYTHCITRFASDICSPLDRQPSNIVPFQAAIPAPCAKQYA